jgi:magnesium-protoporphyrin O-methyltransferase
VDASRAYVSVAHEEAERQGHGDRVEYLTGDFVILADRLQAADLVALDRVICCYRNMAELVGRSATLARHRYGVVYPRDTWLGRLGTTFINARFRLLRSPFRTYIHRTTEVEGLLAAHGLVKRMQRTTMVWQLEIYERQIA